MCKFCVVVKIPDAVFDGNVNMRGDLDSGGRGLPPLCTGSGGVTAQVAKDEALPDGILRGRPGVGLSDSEPRYA